MRFVASSILLDFFTTKELPHFEEERPKRNTHDEQLDEDQLKAVYQFSLAAFTDLAKLGF